MSAVLNVAEMIDLALGTPEVGTVDFVMLHTVLHCLAQQIRCTDKTVEVRGSLATLPVGRQPDNALTVMVNEFVVEVDGRQPGPDEDVDTILVAERVNKSERVPISKPPKSTVETVQGGASRSTIAGRGPSEKKLSVMPAVPAKSAKSVAKVGRKSTGGITPDDGNDGDDETAPAPAPEAKAAPSRTVSAAPSRTVSAAPSRTASAQLISSTEKLSLVTVSKFNVLQSTVDDLKNRVYGVAPNNEELLEAVRSQTNATGITDMWASLNVQSRLEAAEEGIAKLTSLMQDLIAKDPVLQQTAGPVGLPEVTTPPCPPDCATKAEVDQLLPILQTLKDELYQLTDAFYDSMKTMGQPMEQPSRKDMTIPATSALSVGLASAPAVNTTSSAQTGTPAPTPVPTAAPAAAVVPAGPPAPAAAVVPAGPSATAVGPTKEYASAMQELAALSEKLKKVEQRLNQCYGIVFSANGTIQDQVNSLQDQIDENARRKLAADVGNVNGSPGGPSPELVNELQGLMALYQTVNNMQNQLQQVHETALKLSAEREDRQVNINSLLEQIEFLKAIKLDREDMMEALADKADVNMLARKVSHDQFELACDDLSRGLEHALGKLNIQESLWQQALDDVQREIEVKLDKVELKPLKEYFQRKFKEIQENLKKMAALRKEVEAAGTKKKLFTDVNCISCDAQAFMQSTASTIPLAKPMKPSKSIKPYLTYELDAIRKSQSSSIPQRNMNDWEKIDKQMTTPEPVKKVRSDTGKHLCNRYCGGSHTTTTANQRVARIGHFIQQWGPEVLPLTSGYATGDDGRLYKVSEVESVAVGPGGAVDVPCTPKAPVKRERKLPTMDCRCIDDVLPPRK